MTKRRCRGRTEEERAGSRSMCPILVGNRSPEEWPESPEPLVPETKEDVTEKRMRLRGMYDTRMAALGGAKLRPLRPAGAAWKISFASSMPCMHAKAMFNVLYAADAH